MGKLLDFLFTWPPFFIALLFFLRGKRVVFWEGLAYFG
ncbi:MAG: hypothetical protein DDT30_00204 [Dehalococcoidia bacterium]|nr:hypothetical protein [Bacillota bacterium]